MNGKISGGGGAMLSPDTMQALRVVREQLASRKAQLEQALVGIDLVLGDQALDVEPVSVKSNGKPLRKVKLPILGKAKGAKAMRLAVLEAITRKGGEGMTTDEVRVAVKAKDIVAIRSVQNSLQLLKVAKQIERDDETKRWRLIA